MSRIPTVHIEREPFLVMVMAAIETGKKECLGYLFGTKPSDAQNAFRVTFAVPLQSVKRRSNQEVVQSDSGSKRLRQLFAAAPYAYPLIGDFHSHPEWGSNKPVDEMSKTDIKNTDDGEVAVIIAAYPAKGYSSRWRSTDDGGIFGTKCGRALSLKAYRIVKDDENESVAEQLRIVAPGALRILNRK